MPIYAYKCQSCGFSKDVLQKLSDSPLTGCPACGAEAFRKQLTAAGFQLKGSGWYATDFKGAGVAPPAAAPAAAAPSPDVAATTAAKPVEATTPKSNPASASGAGGAGGGACSGH